MKASSISINKSRHKRDPKKSKLIRTIFEIEDVKSLDPPKNKNIIKINYDKNIYFQKPNQEKEIANIISNVINPNSTKTINSNNIQLNVNINNNYYGPYNNNYSKTIDTENHNYINKKSYSSINSKNTFSKTMDSTNSINNSINTNDNLNNENNKNRNIYKEKASYALLEFKSRQSNKMNHFRTATKNNLINSLKSNDNFSKTMKNIRKPEKLSTEPSNSSIEKVMIIPKVEKKESDDLIKFIPCMNCGNLISFDEIEKHSYTCTKVSDEIIKNDISKVELNPIDYKLKKLQEHLLSLLNMNNKKNNYENKKNDIEIMFLSTVLSEYIKEVLELQNIDIPSIKQFKKVLKNLENISIKYKDNISDLILIDRTKTLVNEKLKIFKSSYKKDFDNKKRNLSKNGTLKYEEDLKIKLKQLEKLNAETELEKTKVKNLRKSAGPANRPKYIRNLSNSIISEKKEESMISDYKENNNNNNNNINTVKVDEIISDIENNTSNIFSVNTSMSNISSYNNNDGSFLNNKFLKGNDNSLRFSLENLNNIYNNENEINDNRNDYNNNNNNILNNSNNSNDEYEKREKKKFFNEVLKIKFEKLHSTHKGQLINQKYIWDECKRQNIPKKNWSEFILGELNNPYKYLEIQKKEKRNKSRKAPMAVITEENN